MPDNDIFRQIFFITWMCFVIGFSLLILFIGYIAVSYWREYELMTIHSFEDVLKTVKMAVKKRDSVNKTTKELLW